MEKIVVKINSEYITFSNLLKLAGVIQTGGQTNYILEEKLASLNGVLIYEKRKKIRDNDVVKIGEDVEITVKMEE